MEDYERVIEFSCDSLDRRYTARFANGDTITLLVDELPAKLLGIHHKWDEAFLNDDKSTLMIPRQLSDQTTAVLAYRFFARGTIVGYCRSPTFGPPHALKWSN